jgi:hypothetical protein
VITTIHGISYLSQDLHSQTLELLYATNSE